MKKIIIHQLTQGEINSTYLNISQNSDFFPVDSIGGSNKKSLAEKKLMISFGSGEPIETDIAGDKMVFRKRSWFGEFLSLYKLKAGDFVSIERTEPYKYNIYPKKQ